MNEHEQPVEDRPSDGRDHGAAVGAAVGGAQGMLLALALGAGMNFLAYGYSDAMVLRMYGAREVDAQMMIVNPLSGGGVAGPFSTHPSTEERVARLLALA